MTEQVIPNEAVAAVAKVVVEEGAYGVPWGDASDNDREDAMKKALAYLEAAAPHMVAEAHDNALDEKAREAKDEWADDLDTGEAAK